MVDNMCHKSNKVWSESQDSRQIHRSAVERVALTIRCSTDAICRSTTVTASTDTCIALALHLQQTTSGLSPVSC